MPMFVCLAGYLDVLAFPPRFINVDFKAGIFICESKKKSKYPVIFKFVFITIGLRKFAYLFGLMHFVKIFIKDT